MKGCEVDHGCASLVRRAGEFLGLNWSVRLSHMWREGNHLADWLLALLCLINVMRCF